MSNMCSHVDHFSAANTPCISAWEERRTGREVRLSSWSYTNCDYPSVSINRVTVGKVSVMSSSLCLHRVLMSVSCVTGKRTCAFTEKRWIIQVSLLQFKCMRKRKGRSEICR